MVTIKKITALVVAFLLCLFCVACEKNEKTKSTVDTALSSSVAKVEYQSKEMSDNLFDYKIQIENDVYKLPCKLEVFLDNGWELPSYFDKTKNIDSDHLESAYLSKDGIEIRTQIINLSGNQKNVMDCSVGRVEFDFSKNIKVYIAKNTELSGLKPDDIIAKFGEPTSNEKYDDLPREMVYETPNAEWTYERYTFRFDRETEILEELSIVNFVESSDDITQTSEDGIEYLEKYVAPKALGNDIKNFNVSVMGDVYSLPAPVSEFVKNGWQIVETKDVKAGTYEYEAVTMQKNGITYSFNAFNFSKNQVDGKNATIYEIEQATYSPDIKVVLPGNISVGTPLKEVEKQLENSDFKKNDSKLSIEYIYTTQGCLINVNISKENDTVESVTVINKVCSYNDN